MSIAGFGNETITSAWSELLFSPRAATTLRASLSAVVRSARPSTRLRSARLRATTSRTTTRTSRSARRHTVSHKGSSAAARAGREPRQQASYRPLSSAGGDVAAPVTGTKRAQRCPRPGAAILALSSESAVPAPALLQPPWSTPISLDDSPGFRNRFAVCGLR